MFLVMQSFPEEKILFASSSEGEASNFFKLQLKHGAGWFELWEEGCEMPIQAGGEQFYSPYQPNKWDVMRTMSTMTEYDKKKLQNLSNGDRHNLIVTTWE